jgi:hypothetical protein
LPARDYSACARLGACLDAPDRILHCGQLFEGGPLLGEQTAPMPSENLALSRQPDGARAAQNQRCPDTPLEGSDCPAQAGLAQMQPFRRATIVALLAEHEQAANRTKIEIVANIVGHRPR